MGLIANDIEQSFGSLSGMKKVVLVAHALPRLQHLEGQYDSSVELRAGLIRRKKTLSCTH